MCVYRKCTEHNDKNSDFLNTCTGIQYKIRHTLNKQIAAHVSKAEGQMNSCSFNMNLLPQTPFKAQQTPGLSKRTPQIHLTNLQMKQNLHNTAEQLTYQYFPRHRVRLVQEIVLRLQTLGSVLSDSADRAFGGSFAYRLLALIPAAQHSVLSAVLTSVCRAVLGIKARNESAFKESNEEVGFMQNSSLILLEVQPHNNGTAQ